MMLLNPSAHFVCMNACFPSAALSTWTLFLFQAHALSTWTMFSKFWCCFPSACLVYTNAVFPSASCVYTMLFSKCTPCLHECCFPSVRLVYMNVVFQVHVVCIWCCFPSARCVYTMNGRFPISNAVSQVHALSTWCCFQSARFVYLMLCSQVLALPWVLQFAHRTQFQCLCVIIVFCYNCARWRPKVFDQNLSQT